MLIFKKIQQEKFLQCSTAICYNAVAPNICSQISIYFIYQVFHIVNNGNSQIYNSRVMAVT